MGFKVIKPSDVQKSDRERIIIYGRAGIGKTRLGLSLTERFGKIVYYAADDNSEFLTSISPRKRERIYVIKPEGDDPIKNFTMFCMTDWKKIDPEINTLVVDTFTKVCQDVIQFSAASGVMTNEKHFIIGDPNAGGVSLPNRGDYLGLESLGRGFLEKLFFYQKDLHIIFIQHEDVKIIENVHAVGGPAVPGRSLLEAVPASFNTVIRLIREQILVPGASSPEDVVVAITDNDGKFVAKIRTSDEVNKNPLSRVVLDRDSNNFFTLYDAIVVGMDTPE